MKMNDINIEHVIPQLGFVSFPLYQPANWLYEELETKKELRRLFQLRHLGSLSFALEGARLARWDYTAALLYFSWRFQLYGFNSSFNLGGEKFSSSIAALQCISLVWNIGHLPGTFATEKGVYRFLYDKNPDNPVDVLNWPFNGTDDIERIKSQAKRSLDVSDYACLSRVLAVIKLLRYCKNETDKLYGLTVGFIAPFLLGYDLGHSIQWSKLRSAFSLIRHLSYLTVDIPFSGQRWSPNVPDLFDYYMNRKDKEILLEELADCIRELLSPIEKQIYDQLYHSDRARAEVSILASAVTSKLHKISKPSVLINNWSDKGLKWELKINTKKKTKVNRCVLIRLRSHFASHPDKIVAMEKGLKSVGFDLSSVYKYKAWNSETMFEPDEILIDIIISNTPSQSDIGRILNWYMNEFEKYESDPSNFVEFMRKQELESGYTQILSKAVEIHYPGIKVQLDPWNLDGFGLFRDVSNNNKKWGRIWACRAPLDDPYIKYLLRNRERYVPRGLTAEYSELLGLAELRRTLKRKWGKTKPRCKWLVISASVKFQKDGRSILEYDGALLKISSRSGKMTWYGLETKSGKANPTNSLENKHKAIKIEADVHSLNSNHAYAEIQLY